MSTDVPIHLLSFSVINVRLKASAMGSFGHGPAITNEPEDLATSRRNARYGLVLFVVYCLLYAGFVGLNAFAPATMTYNLAGISLAVWYGLTLILAAMFLAAVYTVLCRKPAPPTP